MSRRISFWRPPLRPAALGGSADCSDGVVVDGILGAMAAGLTHSLMVPCCEVLDEKRWDDKGADAMRKRLRQSLLIEIAAVGTLGALVHSWVTVGVGAAAALALHIAGLVQTSQTDLVQAPAPQAPANGA